MDWDLGPKTKKNIIPHRGAYWDKSRFSLVKRVRQRQNKSNIYIFFSFFLDDINSDG